MSFEDVTDINETRPKHEGEENFVDFMMGDTEEEFGQFCDDQTDFLYYNELLDNRYDDFDDQTTGTSLTDQSQHGDGIEINKLVNNPDLSFYNNNDDNGEGVVERLRSKREELTCGHCGYITTYKNDFKSHLRRHIRSDEYRSSSRSQKYKCDKCQYTTDRKGALTRHMTVHKRIVIKLKLKFEPTKDNDFKCKQCEFTTRRWKDFKLHIPKHNPLDGKVYKCEFCDFTTKWRQNLKPHVETHKQSCKTVEAYKCDRCAYTTKLKRYLTQHYQRHRASKQYECRQCGFSTNWHKHLKQHAEVHNSSMAYQCADCGFTTNSKRNLKIHFKKYGGLTSHAK